MLADSVGFRTFIGELIIIGGHFKFALGLSLLSKTNGNIAPFYDGVNPAFHMTDLQMEYDTADGKWSLSAWVKNVRENPVVALGKANYLASEIPVAKVPKNVLAASVAGSEVRQIRLHVCCWMGWSRPPWVEPRMKSWST